ncbi:hypothetical protein G6F60_014414 [Rhizopus arrhizus]|nr:hypothetical protein G6F60_014414 [Rhizopus arrhizus]
MPRTEVIDLQMSVDAALKYIVSMGVVAPAQALAPEDRPAPLSPAPGVQDAPRADSFAVTISARPSPCTAG